MTRVANAIPASNGVQRGPAPVLYIRSVYLDGKNLRNKALIDRKRMLRKIVPKNSPFLVYVDYVEAEGERLFKLVCDRDLKGIVAKHRQRTAILHG